MSLELANSQYKLEDLCLQITDGKHGDCENQEKSGYYFVSVKDIDEGEIDYSNARQITKDDFEDTDKRTKLENEDILITNSGTIGKFVFVNSPLSRKTTFQKSVAIIKPDKNKILPKFLYYYLISEKRRLIEYAGGTTQKNLLLRDIRNFEVEIPNEIQQKKIINILNDIDNLIKVKKTLNKNLDDLLDSLFKEHFINKFDNADINWKIKKIDELPLIITDYVANGSFASLKENVSILDHEDYAYFIRNTDLKAKCFEKFVNKHSYDFLKKSSLYGNEIIISNVGDVGSVFLCPFLDKPMTLGNNMILVKSNDDAIYLNFYLFLLFRSNFGQYLISTITAGSVQSKFNKTEFKSLELIMPDDEVIIKFNEFVSPIFDYKNKISDEITNLTKLRDTLLPKLMSGEIDVSEINCDLE